MGILTDWLFNKEPKSEKEIRQEIVLDWVATHGVWTDDGPYSNLKFEECYDFFLYLHKEKLIYNFDSRYLNKYYRNMNRHLRHSNRSDFDYVITDWYQRYLNRDKVTDWDLAKTELQTIVDSLDSYSKEQIENLLVEIKKIKAVH